MATSAAPSAGVMGTMASASSPPAYRTAAEEPLREGAYVNGVRLQVSSAGRLIDALLVTGFPYDVHNQRDDLVGLFGAFLGKARAVRRLGSAAIDLAYVACGRFDGFWEDGLNAWDTAAGMVLIQEARGRVTNFDDEPLDIYTRKVLASNGLIHDAMRSVLLHGANRSL